VLRNRGDFDAYRGQFERAVIAYREAAGSVGITRHEGVEGGMAAAALQSLAQLLATKGELKAARVEAEQALLIQPESPRCLYFAGFFAVREGDVPAAEGFLKRLTEVAAEGRHATGDLYRDGLQAEIALAQGKPAQARSLFEGVAHSGRLLFDFHSHISSAGPAFRDGLARTYLALGENRKAADTLSDLVSSGYERLNHPTTYVRALHTLGKLKMEMGDESAGRELLRRFRDHWGKAAWNVADVGKAHAVSSSEGDRVTRN
jgi:tetratricopeptide (TPR) repeat protein